MNANLFVLGVIGECVGKAYMESKGRRRYIVAERTCGPDSEAEDNDSGVLEEAMVLDRTEGRCRLS